MRTLSEKAVWGAEPQLVCEAGPEKRLREARPAVLEPRHGGGIWPRLTVQRGGLGGDRLDEVVWVWKTKGLDGLQR